MPTIDARTRRQCKECETVLNYNDERYELRHITFKQFQGQSQNIKVHLCPTCAEILMQGLLDE